ncbi:PREDICTED: uncharacterized protein LOC109241191 [Nicotiana attenuata]|uniref:uncharacterized protein LOC109241191 n=1 Tax=Nicotiana attenuata TaxID=49451 RepID=UPI000905D5DE|nr:PREDICTED: uncharacterized protein LOC109241191 [Nicotiana attenuata]
MDYLSRLLRSLKNQPDFNYHPRCEKLQIIKLEFADDLLLFCRGDEVSIQMLYNCFQEFSKMSGLKANTSKSSIYFGGVNTAVQQNIMEKLGFPKGELPIKYMGVPLSTKRMSIIQFQPLLDKMLAICKLLWNLAQKKDKLWVQWIHTYYGKGKAVNCIEANQASWLVKKILNAKHYMIEAGINLEEILEKKCLTINSIYKMLRKDHQKVQWRKLVCNNGGMPKWNFILYMALLGKLSTRDRLARWGVINETLCPMCKVEEESMEHLFFKCSFTAGIWSKILRWIGINRQPMEWSQEVDWACSNAKSRSANS